MKCWPKQIEWGYLVFLFLLIVAPAEAQVHEFAGRCEECHLGRTGDDEMIFVEEVGSLCRSCHAVTRINSHPSGMLVERDLPPEFRLDIEGRMTCTTCHNPCLDATADNPYLLVSFDSPEGFCVQCHPTPSFCSGDDETIFELTHARAWTPPTEGGGTLDRISLDCIACHSDSGSGPSAATALHESVSDSRGGFDAIHGSHPVGQDYAAISAENLNLRAIDDLSPLIALVEGKVGCASCHNPYSEERHFLVFSNNGSALCRECHLL